jgi:nucleotidyltransferase substrate binding protein (TIGR01987 family)
MAEMEKLADAVDKLGRALTFEKKAKSDPFYSAGLAKSFEICFEYAWKYFRRVAAEHGLDAFSPRDAIKTAGRLGLIDDVETWLAYLEDRNLSVHDYLGVQDQDYLKTMKSFHLSAKELLSKK